MNNLPYPIALIQALGPSVLGLATAVIAAIVAAITFRNWQTAKEKMRLDLYDRRFAVFMQVREIASVHGDRNRMSDQGLPNEVIAQGRFLFGEEVMQTLKEIHAACTAHDLRDFREASKINSLFDRFIDQMKPYLDFSKLP